MAVLSQHAPVVQDRKDLLKLGVEDLPRYWVRLEDYVQRLSFVQVKPVQAPTSR